MSLQVFLGSYAAMICQSVLNFPVNGWDWNLRRFYFWCIMHTFRADSFVNSMQVRCIMIGTLQVAFAVLRRSIAAALWTTVVQVIFIKSGCNALSQTRVRSVGGCMCCKHSESWDNQPCSDESWPWSSSLSFLDRHWNEMGRILRKGTFPFFSTSVTRGQQFSCLPCRPFASLYN